MIALIGNIVRNKNLVDGSERVEIDFGELNTKDIASIIDYRKAGEVGIIFCEPQAIEDLKELLNNLNNL